MSADIKKKTSVMTKIQISFLLQLDESTDKSGLAVVLVFVHYLFQNKTEYDILHKSAVLKRFPFPKTSLQNWIFKVCGNKIQISLQPGCHT
jgi:hypothetical protein